MRERHTASRHGATRRDEAAGTDPRARLLAGAPVTERRLPLAGVDTAVLEGGEGPPVVILHGQGALPPSACPWWQDSSAPTA